MQRVWGSFYKNALYKFTVIIITVITEFTEYTVDCLPPGARYIKFICAPVHCFSDLCLSSVLVSVCFMAVVPQITELID